LKGKKFDSKELTKESWEISKVAWKRINTNRYVEGQIAGKILKYIWITISLGTVA
jgi:hypothetical protein